MKKSVKNEKEIIRTLIYAQSLRENFDNDDVVNVEDTAIAVTEAAMYLVDRMNLDNGKYSVYDIMDMIDKMSDVIINELMNIYCSRFDTNIPDSEKEAKIALCEMKVSICSIISRIGQVKYNTKIIDETLSINDLIDLNLEAVRAMRPSRWA